MAAMTDARSLRSARVVFPIFGLVGIGLLVLAACFTAKTLLFLRHSAGAVGVVDRLERVERRNDDGQLEVTFAPVFSFITAHDQAITVTSKSSSNPPGYLRQETRYPCFTIPRTHKTPVSTRIGSCGGAETIVAGVGAVFCILSLGWAAFMRKSTLRTNPISPH